MVIFKTKPMPLILPKLHGSKPKAESILWLRPNVSNLWSFSADYGGMFDLEFLKNLLKN